MHYEYLTMLTFNDKSQLRNDKCLISDFGFRIAELEMRDVGCEIVDFALCPEPCALRLTPPDT
jgi:hypothetical protein